MLGRQSLYEWRETLKAEVLWHRFLLWQTNKIRVLLQFGFLLFIVHDEELF